MAVRLATGLAVLLLFVFTSGEAHALPTIFDHWHFSCAKSKNTAKLLNKANAQAQGGGVKGAIASLEYACLLHIREFETYQARLAKFQEQGGKGAQPQLDQRGSTAAIRKAVGRLAAAYKSAKKNPAVVYHYAYALALTGDVEAVNRFDEVMTGFTNTPWGAQAALALGEFYFERKDLPKANREYGVALKSKKPVIQAYTRYKKAWIDYALAVEGKNAERQRAAIQSLASLARKTAAGDKETKRLAEVIKADLLDLLAQSGNLAESRKILASVNAMDVYATLVERMAYARLGANDAKSAYKLFAIALKEAPERPEAIQLSDNLVRLAGQLNDVNGVVANLKAMVSTYAKGKSPWRSKQKKEVLAKAETQVENILVEYTGALDQQGRATGQALYLNGARQLYVLYLKTFPKKPRAYDVRIAYGQLLFVQKQYDQSARMLLGVLKQFPKGKSNKDVSDVMVTAAQFAVDNDKTKYNIPEPGTALAEQKIPQIKKTYADCLDAFMKVQPANANVPMMKYAAGSVYYDFGHYKEAEKRYFEYVEKHPTGEFAKPAAYRILLVHQKAKDDEALDKATKRLAKVQAIRSAPEFASFFAPKQKPKTKTAKQPKGKSKGEAETDAAIADSSPPSNDGDESGAEEGGVEKAADDTAPDAAADDTGNTP